MFHTLGNARVVFVPKPSKRGKEFAMDEDLKARLIHQLKEDNKEVGFLQTY